MVNSRFAGAERRSGTSDPSCSGSDSCPRGEAECLEVRSGAPCPPLWDVCLLGSGCVELFLKFVSVVNPADSMQLDRFEILNDTLFAQPLATLTASQAAQGIANLAQGGGFASAAGRTALPSVSANGDGRVRVEIWRRGTPPGPDAVVRVVGEYALSQTRSC